MKKYVDTNEFLPVDEVEIDSQINQDDLYWQGYRDAASRSMEHLKELFVELLAAKAQPLFVLHCAVAAYGLWDLIPYKGQAEIAKAWGCEKAAVNWQVKRIQKALHLPPTLGQRDQEGRDNMSIARKDQLK